MGGELQPGAERRDQGLDWSRRKKARRAASEENTVDAPSPDVGKRELEIRDQRFDVGPLGNIAPRLVGIEIAVRALLHAPGNVHVERQGREHAKPDAGGGASDYPLPLPPPPPRGGPPPSPEGEMNP